MSKENQTLSPLYTLFPVTQKNGDIVYYASDFTKRLGGAVYKGYRCRLINPDFLPLKPCRVRQTELQMEEESVAIKLYDGEQHPSPYQFYSSERAILTIEGRDALIMDFIDGVHIYPDARNNPTLKELDFLQAVDIAWQLILGLNQLHYNNASGPSIVHGDIKGENVKIKIVKIDTDEGKHYKIDVNYLDLDYAKPITNTVQVAQGTPEHIALEILDGFYSESSDFFALSPLLLSIFGAHNPLRKIIEYRDRHASLQQNELVRKFRDIGFCTNGIFEHFEKKPAPFVCQLVENFILQMAEKNQRNRPTPNAILEFFTALRQLCLADALNQDNEVYLLRLCITAGNERWLTENKQHLFFNLNDNLQHRFISLMNTSQIISFYKTLQENKDFTSLMMHLRKNMIHHLREKSLLLEKPSFINSIFGSPITQKDLQWLLECYENHEHARFSSREYKQIRKKLENCTDKNLAPLISIMTGEMAKRDNCDPSRLLLRQ